MGVDVNLHPDFQARRTEMWEAYQNADYQRAAEVAAMMLQDSLAFDAIHMCGIALPKLHNYDQGFDFACASLSLTKPRVEWYINASKVYMDEKMFVHAMRFVVNGLEAFPDDCTLLYHRGLCLCQTLAFEDGIKAFDITLEKHPDFFHARMSKGFALHMLGRYDEAMACYDAVEKAADGVDALTYEQVVNNRACVLMELGRNDEVLWLLENVCREPDRDETLYNKSMIWLGQGKWPEAWHLYRLRDTVQTKSESGIADVGLTMAKTLDDIRGKHLFLFHEQGLGDSLMFFRYAPILRPYVSKLTVGVPRTLERMAKRLIFDSGYDYDVVSGRDLQAEKGQIARCDIAMPLLDAPAILDQHTDNIPNARYFADPPDALVRQHWLGDRDRRMRVGLVWAGASRVENMKANAIDKRRSIPFPLMEPILQLSDAVEFVSLQLSDQRVDDSRIRQPLQDGFDVLDTAAIVAQLDMVITIDSAMCHLAAALGKRTWMLSRFDGCWRWFWPASKDDPLYRNTPFYPSMRIFRQERIGDWASVVDEVRRELSEEVA